MKNHNQLLNLPHQAMKNPFSKKNKAPKKPLTVDQKITRRNFISFSSFIALSGAAYGGWKWLYNSPEEVASITAGARKPLRSALNKTELAVRQIFSNNNLVKTYPKEMAAKNVRYNSDIGI